MTTEELKHEMYEQLAAIRKARKHPIMLRNFEDDLEAYLEALRVERERDVMVSAELIDYRDLMRDAYDRQKQLTQSACVSYRELEDRLRQISIQHDEMLYEHTAMSESTREATAKLASQTQTIIALHTVIKNQKTALIASQRLLEKSESDRKRDKANFADERAQNLEAFDETLARCEKKQELIVSQRKAIETLTFELASVQKRAERPSFWQFLTRKSTKAKILPEKTN